MLMLILKLLLKNILCVNLNTSHVNVNQSLIRLENLYILYLNTSHVNVNPMGVVITNPDMLFKYISC